MFHPGRTAERRFTACDSSGVIFRSMAAVDQFHTLRAPDGRASPRDQMIVLILLTDMTRSSVVDSLGKRPASHRDRKGCPEAGGNTGAEVLAEGFWRT